MVLPVELSTFESSNHLVNVLVLLETGELPRLIFREHA